MGQGRKSKKCAYAHKCSGKEERKRPLGGQEGMGNTEISVEGDSECGCELGSSG